MTLDSLPLARWAAPGALAATLLFAAASALAQDDAAAPEGTDAAAPVEAVEPADATAAPAPEAAAQTPDVIPVQTGEAEETPQAVQLDAIEVTGSRIKRTDFETAQPVLVLTREDIERTGLTNIGDILQRIPSAGSALNRSFNNGGNGQTEIDLRNLGSQRVLVLVNGQRWVAGTSLASSSVDLNTIPVSIIERIEVLKDGASAIYGSDAITGVVNVITRKDFAGSELRTQFSGFSSGPTAGQQQHNLSYGTSSGKTSLFFDFNYVRQNALFASARDISRVPKVGTGNTRGSLFTPRGTVVLFTDEAHADTLNGAGGNPGEPPLCVSVASVVVDELAPVAGVPGQGAFLCLLILKPGETIGPNETLAQAAPKYERFIKNSLDDSVNDAYNYAPINYLLTPFEQQSIFTQINHQLLDNVAFNATVLLNISKTERNLAETPLLFGQGLGLPPPYNSIFIDINNVYNPLESDVGRDNSTSGVGPGAGILARRFTELGPRFVGRNVNTLLLNGGFNGNFDLINRLFSWDFNLRSAVSDNTNEHKGDLRLDAVKLALGPSFIDPATQRPTCGTSAIPIPGCVPLNLFGGPGSMTKEMLDYVKYDATSTARSQSASGTFNISTEIADFSGKLPYNLLPAPIGVALGGEYREESFSESPDPFTTTNNSSTNLRQATNGGYDTTEAYVEFSVPVVSDLPFADTVDLSLAARNVKYSTFGEKTSGKFGLRYKPFDDLLIRSTVSEAFRAPNVQELFLGTTDSFPAVTDPCAASPRPANVNENCNEEGSPPTTQQLNSQVLTRFGGNPRLTPETADTLTAGIVYSPSYLPDFNVYVDWYRIELVDAISFKDTQEILDTCYGRASGASRPTDCDRVRRDTNGSITFIENLAENLSEVRTSGVEVAFDYVLPVREVFERFRGLKGLDLGAFKLTVDTSYLDYYNEIATQLDGSKTVTKRAGTAVSNQPFPRFKANTGLEWTRNNWKASWTTRFIGGSIEPCVDPARGLFDEPRLQELGLCSMPDADLVNDTDGDGEVDDSKNKLPAKLYHNVQVGYSIPEWRLDVTLGAVNILNQDPARSTVAFANSFSSTLYEVPGIQPYLRINMGF